MKADYTKDKVRLFNCDCMDFMKEVPDNYYELAIVDPPYGIGVDGQKEQINNKNPKHNRKLHTQKQWDKDIPDKKYFEELFRISKNQIIWGANYFAKYLHGIHKGWVIWDKGQRGLTMSDCEIAYTSFDTATRIITLNRVALLIEGTIHPTQKPTQLYSRLLNDYAKPNDKIFDSHGGSFSSACACLDMGFEFDGCEIDEEYFKSAVNRLENHNQLYLDF